MDGEVGGQREQRRVELAQPLERHRRFGPRRGAGRRRLGLRLDEVLFRLERVVGRLQLRQCTLGQRVDLLAGRSRRARPACRAQISRTVGCAAIFWYISGCVKRRLVPLVVAVAAVADQVDQEVALELRAVGERQPRRLDAGFRVVGIDVDDRNLEARAPARSRTSVL